jgi:hypothetical protein
MSDRLGWSQTKISRFENGLRTLTEVETAIFLASCGIPRAESDPLVDLARETDEDYRMRPHEDRFPDELRTLIFHETTALSIENYEPVYIPGLAQSEDYTRSLLLESGAPEENIGFWVRARADRQQIIKRQNAPRFTFYVHEQALRIPVGNLRIMQEQMIHLMFLADRPGCDVRVVPISAGGRGLAGCGFELFGYPRDVSLYVENQTTSLFTQREADVAAYKETLSRVAKAALDAEQSRSFLAGLANEYDRAE